MDRDTLPRKERNPEQNTASKIVVKRHIHIPELYRRPTPDRDTQGCMKARA